MNSQWIYWKLIFGVQGGLQEVGKSRRAVDSTSQQLPENSGSFQIPEDRNCSRERLDVL